MITNNNNNNNGTTSTTSKAIVQIIVFAIGTGLCAGALAGAIATFVSGTSEASLGIFQYCITNSTGKTCQTPKEALASADCGDFDFRNMLAKITGLIACVSFGIGLLIAIGRIVSPPSCYPPEDDVAQLFNGQSQPCSWGRFAQTLMRNVIFTSTFGALIAGIMCILNFTLPICESSTKGLSRLNWNIGPTAPQFFASMIIGIICIIVEFSMDAPKFNDNNGNTNNTQNNNNFNNNNGGASLGFSSGNNNNQQYNNNNNNHQSWNNNNNNNNNSSTPPSGGLVVAGGYNNNNNNNNNGNQSWNNNNNANQSWNNNNSGYNNNDNAVPNYPGQNIPPPPPPPPGGIANQATHMFGAPPPPPSSGWQ